MVIATLDGAPVGTAETTELRAERREPLAGLVSGRVQIRSQWDWRARITVTDSAGKKQIFDANTSGSYLASNDPRIVVGLGADRECAKS